MRRKQTVLESVPTSFGKVHLPRNACLKRYGCESGKISVWKERHVNVTRFFFFYF